MKKPLRIAIPLIAVAAIVAAVVLYNEFAGRADGPEARPAKQEKGGERGGKAGGDRKIAVSIHIADYLKITEGVRAIGTLLPYEVVEVASEVAGKIERISFEEGARVSRGDILVKINDDDLQSQLRRATFQRNLLKEKLDRSRILLEKDAISREAFDQVETDFNMVQADIELLEVRIGKTSIRAPFDGVAGFRYVSPGSYIQPGARIARVVDNSRLRLEFSIPEKYYSDALRGTQVRFTVENDRSPHYARIYAVDPTVDATTRTVIMRALYENRGLKIIPGMYADLVVGQKDGESIQIPTEAIVPDANNKKVWLVREGRAHLQDVVTGTRSENMIEVKAGLSAGDSVIVTGLMQVREGSQLIITD